MVQLAVSSNGMYIVGVRNDNSIWYRTDGCAGSDQWEGIYSGMGTPTSIQVTNSGEIWAIGTGNALHYKKNIAVGDWEICQGYLGINNIIALSASDDGNKVAAITDGKQTNGGRQIVTRDGFANGVSEGWTTIWHAMGTPKTVQVSSIGDITAINNGGTISNRNQISGVWVGLGGGFTNIGKVGKVGSSTARERVYETGPYTMSSDPTWKQTLTWSSQSQCRNACLNDAACVSYGWKKTSTKCSLNNKPSLGDVTYNNDATILVWNLLPVENTGRCTCVNNYSLQEGKYCYYKVGATSTYAYPTNTGAPGGSSYVDGQSVESCAILCEKAYPGSTQFFLKIENVGGDKCACCDQTKDNKIWPEGDTKDMNYQLYTLNHCTSTSRVSNVYEFGDNPEYCQTEYGEKIGVFFGADINEQAQRAIESTSRIDDEAVFNCSSQGYNSCELYKNCDLGGKDDGRYYSKKIQPPRWDEYQLPLCSSCQPGQYTSSNEGCVLCEPGKYTATKADSSSPTGCRVCPEGRFQRAEGSTECIQCFVGLYTNNEMEESCKDCATGKYQDEVGTTQCKYCGREDMIGAIATSTGQSTCSQCTPGLYETTGTECMECGTGQYQPESKKDNCHDCPLGTYQMERGTTMCKECGSGKYAPVVRQIICKDCVSGQYQDNNGQELCKLCESGKYQVESGKKTCHLCLGGKLCSAAGIGDSCSSGQYLEPGEYASSCKKCPVDKTHNSDKKSCRNCPAGKTTNGLSGTTCVACPARGFKYNKIASWLVPQSNSYSFTIADPVAPLSWPFYDNADNTGLSHCQADCDSDNDCLGALICKQQDVPTFVPGCRITDILAWALRGTWDHCVYPESYTSTYTTARINSVTGWVARIGSNYGLSATSTLLDGDMIVYYDSGYTQLGHSQPKKKSWKRSVELEKLNIECRSWDWRSKDFFPNYDGVCQFTIGGAKVFQDKPSQYCVDHA